MTITLYGVDPSIDEAKWAELMAILGRGANDEVVDNGLLASAATGTRLISVTAGDAVAAGVLAKSNAAGTVALDANSSGNIRIDYVVLKIDWSGSSTTGGTLTFVKGTPSASPVPPALTQTPGGIWHIPLARVTVRNGVGQIAAGDVEPCRPLARRSKEASQVVSGRTINKSNADIVCETLTIADPGWTYRIAASGWVELATAADGHTTFAIQVNGTTVTKGRSANGNVGRAAMVSRASDTITGASTITLLATPFGASVNPVIEDGQLNALILPA